MSLKEDCSDIELVEELLYSLQQRNLVYNYNFLYFSNKTIESSLVHYRHPDGWVYDNLGQGTQITLSSNNSCRIVTSSDDDSMMTFKQALHEFPRWESQLIGKTVTAKAYLNLSEGCKVNVSLTDGIVSNIKSLQVAGDVVIELQLDVNSKAKGLHIIIESASKSSVITISKVYANIGIIAIENLPCIVNGIIGERKQYIATENPPAEELSLCNESTELPPTYSRLNSVLNKKFGKGLNGLSILPDIRGYFSRSWNNGSSNDPDASTRTMLGNKALTGDYVGTVEGDVFAEHLHEMKFSTTSIVQGDKLPATGINLTVTSETEKNGGKETRPINIAELFTIKWA